MRATIDAFTAAAKARLNAPANATVDSIRLNGFTLGEVRASVNKVDVGLTNVPNNPVASSLQNVQGSSNFYFSTPAGAYEYYRKNYPALEGNTPSVVNGTFASTRLVSSTVLVDSDQDLQIAKEVTEPFERVFNSWKRISHGGNGTYPSYPVELDTWVYSPADNQIYCTVNSISLVGFISPEDYDDFTFEVRVGVNGTPGDDELVGICFGFVEEGGREHILTAMRTPCGRLYHTDYGGNSIHYPKLFDIWYNLFADDEMDLGSTNGGLKWADGVVDDTRNPFSEMTVPNSGLEWKNFPNGCLIKAVRSGDSITLTTTDLESMSYVPSATVQIDLNSHPALAKFKGRVRIGYVAYSQPRASWVALKRPGSKPNIVDVRDYTTHVWDGSGWSVQQGESYKQYMQPGSFYYNYLNGKVSYLISDKNLITI